MLKLLRKFEKMSPEIVFEWKDRELGAEGWLVLNSLRGGAAGGGTRMRKGLSKQEVVSLAKTMEVKFTVSGPAIGGAKSGINFDPMDPRKNDVLKRWYKAVMPLLKSYYGTGGDMNVDEIADVIPITESYGLWHPQEGIVTGFFHPNEAEKVHKIGQLRLGVSKVIEDKEFTPDIRAKYTVADLITGYGVAESIKHFYALWQKDITGKRAIIQGWGNVGSAVGYYLAKSGVRIVGIMDINGVVINEAGFTLDAIEAFYTKGLQSDQTIEFNVGNDMIWDVETDIFVPCAGSRLVQIDQLEKLVKNGLELISCGANVPFTDKEIFFGKTLAYADNHVAVIPDFIANCGMARVFAFLMNGVKEITDDTIFKDTSDTIYNALARIRKVHTSDRHITKKALEIAISQLVN
ncbi:Glu/Leu/Phe/Val dehydrogenase dimerization domain-containing protein [Confluentibacter flavum]|uniref:Amino acid dehydrogenase n=1 Tax=Confluentibacter flavum TaxID=1909700 RepID=A0A2N3HK43_9FLAO|nr:Glu/Leu/Phe/Val dehydrogenase dimerization domain-containing protein [Confluentibacter flavum]PKQ45345.1 amino acid dehydrogenase [Confluentibacter flavum]